MKEIKRIVFAGGGTAGHIIPALTVIEYLKTIRPEWEFLFIGNNDPKVRELVTGKGIRFTGILAGKVRRYVNFSAFFLNAFDLIKIFLGSLQAWFILKGFKPDLVFLKGGYACVPVGWASKRRGLRLVLHESDVVMGWANRITSRYAEKLFVSFPTECYPFEKKRLIQTGLPVSNQFNEKVAEEEYKNFGLKKDRPIILITGGSQGAGKINELVKPILGNLLENYQIIHQAGKRDYDSFVKYQREKELDGYYVSPFITGMAKAMQMADLVISRASSTILEISYLGKPSILIPLSTSASNHQWKNAQEFEKEKAALVIDETKADSSELLEKIELVINNKALQKELSQNVQKFNLKDAVERISEEIARMVEEKSGKD